MRAPLPPGPSQEKLTSSCRARLSPATLARLVRVQPSLRLLLLRVHALYNRTKLLSQHLLLLV